jgi:hypothetical protein
MPSEVDRVGNAHDPKHGDDRTKEPKLKPIGSEGQLEEIKAITRHDDCYCEQKLD